MSLSIKSDDNFFLARKADDLAVEEVLRLFEEPSHDFLDKLVHRRCHHIFQGGRGSGKTITLRRLSHEISPPSGAYPVLGVYVSADVAEFGPFDEDKIGSSNGEVFEAYLVGLLLLNLVESIRANLNCFALVGRSEESLCEELRTRLFPLEEKWNSFASSSESLIQIVQSMRELATRKLTGLRLADYKYTLSFFDLERATKLIAQTLFVTKDEPLRIFFLLDRYDDMSVFQQAVANGLFRSTSPRFFYIKAAIRPPSLHTLALRTGEKLADPQDFRTINLDSFTSEEDYCSLLRKICSKELEAARALIPASHLPLSIDELLEEDGSAGGYVGFKSFARLSDGLIFNFLFLCEKAVDTSVSVKDLHLGTKISCSAQRTAAKQVSRSVYSTIAAKVTDKFANEQRLVGHLLRQMSQKGKGPRVVFKDIRGKEEMELVWKAVHESILKELGEDSDADPDDWTVEVNKILLPHRQIPLKDNPPLEITTKDFAELRAQVFSHKKHEENAQQKLFASEPLPSLPASAEFVYRVDFGNFVRTHGINAHGLRESLEYSNRVIAKASREFQQKVVKEFGHIPEFLANFVVGIAGSFGRGEARQSKSDADLFVAGPVNQHAEAAENLLAYVSQWFTQYGIQVTPATPDKQFTDPRFRPFPMTIDVDAILETAHKPQDSEEDLTRRMCLIAESTSLYNPGRFDEMRAQILNRMRVYEAAQTNNLPTMLLRDFVSWCNSFIARIEIDAKSGGKYEKRRLQRVFTHWATLLGCLAHVSQGTADCFQTMASVFEMPVIGRLCHVQQSTSSQDKKTIRHIKEILEAYDSALLSLAAFEDTQSATVHASAVDGRKVMETTFRELESLLVGKLTERVRTAYRQITTTP